MIFYCYLHRLGALEPRVEAVACETASALPEVLTPKLDGWMPFDMIEIYDQTGRRVLCVASGETWIMN
jgi:hypothetical protein